MNPQATSIPMRGADFPEEVERFLYRATGEQRRIFCMVCIQSAILLLSVSHWSCGFQTTQALAWFTPREPGFVRDDRTSLGHVGEALAKDKSTYTGGGPVEDSIIRVQQLVRRVVGTAKTTSYPFTRELAPTYHDAEHVFWMTTEIVRYFRTFTPRSEALFYEEMCVFCRNQSPSPLTQETLVVIDDIIEHHLMLED